VVRFGSLYVKENSEPSWFETMSKSRSESGSDHVKFDSRLPPQSISPRPDPRIDLARDSVV